MFRFDYTKVFLKFNIFNINRELSLTKLKLSISIVEHKGSSLPSPKDYKYCVIKCINYKFNFTKDCDRILKPISKC